MYKLSRLMLIGTVLATFFCVAVLVAQFGGAILVWIGFVAAKLVFPGDQFIRVGVPLLLSIWPQTTFYSITGDSLSPVCFGIALITVLPLSASGISEVTSIC